MSQVPPPRRCALVFFGIDRRLDLTGKAIAEEVLNPARDRFEVSASGFLWTPARIDNPRSGEVANLMPPRLHLLPVGDYQCSEPPRLDELPLFQKLASFGDCWNDGLRSLHNLVAQLESLCRATTLSLAQRPDIAVFLRPDLLYHDSFSATLDLAASARGPLALIPHWQPHGGLNDRFAICVGEAAIRAYGFRIKAAIDFCETTRQPLHSEKLLRHALDQARIPVRRIGVRASRVRIDGSIKPEDFSLRGWKLTLRGLAGLTRSRLCSNANTTSGDKQ